MSVTSRFEQNSSLRNVLLIGGILLVSFNLRPALASVGPLIDAIRETTGLSNSLLGLLTTLPLLAFGVVSAFTPLVTRRMSIEKTIAAALLLLTAGLLIRVIPSNTALFGGTLALGIGIAFANVLIPSLVKRDFPKRADIMTSLYSGTLAFGAMVSAGISVPLAFNFNFGWHWSLGIWSVASILAFLLWIPQLKNSTLPKHNNNFWDGLKDLGSSKQAWKVSLFMGLQSLGYYVILAWLPAVLQDHGLSASTAGWMLSLNQGTGAAASVLLPIWAGRMKNQRKIIWLILGIEIISILGLQGPSTVFLAGLWSALLGLALSGGFGLALLFIVLRSPDTETATELSGVAQSIGYLLAALGPIIFGGLHDISNTWVVPLLFLLVSALIKLPTGLGAATPKPVK